MYELYKANFNHKETGTQKIPRNKRACCKAMCPKMIHEKYSGTANVSESYAYCDCQDWESYNLCFRGSESINTFENAGEFCSKKYVLLIKIIIIPSRALFRLIKRPL